MACQHLNRADQLRLWTLATNGERVQALSPSDPAVSVGREAKGVLFASVAGLVVQLASYFAASGWEAHREDLIQQGWVGVCKAFTDFDPTYPVKFSTYCRPKILAALQDWMKRNPVLVQEGGAASTPADVEVQAGHPPESPHHPTRRVVRLLARLSDLERNVVVRHFGLGDGGAWTVAEIAAEMGCSEQRVRQLLQAAMERLKGDRPPSDPKRADAATHLRRAGG